MTDSLHSNFDAIDIALYHLNFLGNEIEYTYKAFNDIIGKVGNAEEKNLWVATTSFILIKSVVFLDEYDSLINSTDEELKPTIIAIKKTVKPAMDQIRERRGLRDFRNHALAHNFRDKNLMISVFENGLSSYDAPKNGYELMVFYNCILMVKKVFQSAFKEKLSRLQNFLDNRRDVIVGNKFISEEAATTKVQQITSEINSNILELKKITGV